jgi:hypothetical protein
MSVAYSIGAALEGPETALSTGASSALAMSDRFTIVVHMIAAKAGTPPFKPWAWEICRDGGPLPVRIRESGFKTEHTATLAGKVALRDFLSGLAEEQAKRDCPDEISLHSGRAERLSLADSQRAALQMLAASPRGYSLPTVMARGFGYEMLQDLVRTGLASVQRDLVGMEKTKLAHLRITAAGRKAIAD